MSAFRLTAVTVSLPIYEQKARDCSNGMLHRLMRTRVSRDTFNALDDVSMDVVHGERIGLLGRNGAGKTSLLKVIGGILPPTRGKIEIDGKTFSAINMGSGLVNAASCWQNIIMRGLSHGYNGVTLRRYVDFVGDRSELGRFLNSPVSSLSTGMRGRLLIAMLDAVKPDILLMDEWVGATDNNVVKSKGGPLQELVESASIFILASHREAILRAYCSRAVVLNKGKIVFSGDVETAIKNNQRINGA